MKTLHVEPTRTRRWLTNDIMVTFVQELVNSLSVASVIILMGIGVTLIFGLTGIINFAHGEFLMLGGIGVWVLVGYGFGYIPALIIAVVLVGLIGFLLERGSVPVHALRARTTALWPRSAFRS